MLADIAFLLMEAGHPLESIREYELPAAYTYLEMKVDSAKKRMKARDEGAGKRKFSHAEILAKIAKQRAK